MIIDELFERQAMLALNMKSVPDTGLIKLTFNNVEFLITKRSLRELLIQKNEDTSNNMGMPWNYSTVAEEDL